MTVLYIVLPLALVLAGLALAAFLWAIRGGQMDDLSTPSVRMLFDDDDAVPKA
jgi:cbb3-type cytochrome oxidase maturation protein